MSGVDGARRAVAYIRQAEAVPELAHDSADSPTSQRRAIEAWARRERVDVRSWHYDLGVEPNTPIAERPALLAAYQAILDHRAGILVAANAERFSHDELVSWLIEREALTQRATIHTADGSRLRARDRREGADENVAHTRGAVDLARSYQRVVSRSRVRKALAEKRARGERVGTIPYGYRLAADGVHVEPDEREQAIVSSVHRLAAEGVSQRAIARQLTARGIAGRTGAPLRQTQIANILRSSSS